MLYEIDEGEKIKNMEPIEVKYPKDSEFSYIWVDTVVNFHDEIAILVDEYIGQVITTNISNIRVINPKNLIKGANIDEK